MLGVGAAALRLGDGAGKRPGARAHLDGAVAGGPHVRVHAHAPVHADGQAGGALAAEGALRVDAAAVHANARRLTLVDVWGADWRGSAGAEGRPGAGQADESIAVIQRLPAALARALLRWHVHC